MGLDAHTERHAELKSARATMGFRFPKVLRIRTLPFKQWVWSSSLQRVTTKKTTFVYQTNVVFFELSVPYGTISAPSVREVCLRQVKCLREWVAHLTSHCAKHNTSQRHRRCFTWQSQTSLIIANSPHL